ncbi:hypothetical protein CFP56_016039 [Quercus suber]|uniref:Uncharacterized protein n=1 Tax=Quercus suber TaxID=58331 RepID=A0AAW0KP51_QUESU
MGEINLHFDTCEKLQPRDTNMSQSGVTDDIFPLSYYLRNYSISLEKLFGAKVNYCILYNMHEFPTGLALPIEKKSRQMEISLSCFALTIESFFSCLAED